ncbi:hypothetical protein ACQJBY_019636 [Aegilops geniculata]
MRRGDALGPGAGTGMGICFNGEDGGGRRQWWPSWRGQCRATTAGGAMIFAAQIFCWKQHFDLLQSARMVLGRLRRRRRDFFCCVDLFSSSEEPFFIFAGTISIFCWNHVYFLLEPYQCISLES